MPQPPRLCSTLSLQFAQRLVQFMMTIRENVPSFSVNQQSHGFARCDQEGGTFARRMAQEFPMWQFLLVDLRCHGDSASIKKRVALSMVDQAAKPLARARPVKVWSLDATPGKVQAGGDGEDHPGELTSFLSTLPKEVSSERYVVKALIEQGFSNDVAQGSEWAIFGRDIGS